jgi:hypothetical protein
MAKLAVTKKATTENQIGIDMLPTCAGNRRIDRVNCATAIQLTCAPEVCS